MSITLPIKNGGSYTVWPSKIVALGLNYLEHIKESQSVDVKNFTDEIPTEPILFPKTPNVLIGPGETIMLPSFLDDYDFENCRTDHEAELAIILKDRIKNVPAEEALQHVLGFSCFNDISQRNLQKGDKAGWYRGKSLDTFGPIGPVIVTPEDIGDPQNLDISCRLNGKTVQSSNTRHMIFKIPEIIAFVSRNFTMEAGDIIITGTPSGVGQIADGDLLEVEIENIGVLSSPVKKEQL
jgi:2-keto-4-pentenoate hydratase/2-oxohepta-3-ene-1,7-dioic acid hydratase in catechol pathway